MQKTDWSGDESTGNLPVSGRLVENYIKSIDDKATPTEELAAGETKAPTSGAVFASLVGTVTNIDVTDSEDGTQYVMTVTQKDGEGGESDREVRFSKYSDDDKVVVNIDLTDASGSSLPASQYLSLGTGFVVRYAVGVGTAGGGEVSGYSDLKAKVVVKRGSTVLSEFQDAEFVGVTAGQSYTFDASPYLKDATTYTVQVEAQAGYDGGTLMKTATARVTMVAMELSTTYSVGNGLADGGYRNDVNIPFTAKGTSGEKNIYYRINGGQPYTLGLSAGSGVQQKNVTVALSEMREGMNVVEAYALHENSGVVSEIHYLTLLKAEEGVTAYAGMMFNHRAAGFQRDWKHPVLEAEQFTAWNFTYVIDTSSMSAYLAPQFVMPKGAYKLARTDREKFIKKLVARAGIAPKDARPGLAYAISKHFVIWFAKTDAARFGGKNVRCLSVTPGNFDTPMGALESGQADVFKKYSALKRNGKPEEIAALFALLLDERLGFLTGADILMDGGVVASGASGLSK